jgi:hypothetical protein
VEALARLGLMVSCVLAIYVGVRTLLIWRRTRMIQELCIGINILSIAAAGLVLTVIGAIAGPPGNSLPWIPYAFGLFGLVAHVAALWIGTWKIFRPSQRWPLPFVATAVIMAVGWMGVALVHNGEAASMGRAMAMWVARGVGMSWAAYECFRYSAMLQKRVALGLADPMMAHRIWLWGVGAVASIVMIVLDISSWFIAGAALGSFPVGLHLTSFFGVIGTMAIALAFFPPRAYVDLIERGALADSEQGH